MAKIFEINPQPLEEEVIGELIDNDYTIKLTAESENLIKSCRKYLDDMIAHSDVPVYGVTTGFGALHDHIINKDQLRQLQKNLVMSHACGTGREVREDIIKLMLLFKIHALSYGKSGVQLETVERLKDMYNAGVYPVIFEQGSLGASGDLAPLAHLVLPLIGMGEIRYKGKKYNSAEINTKMSWPVIELQSKEGLALVNGTQFMSAYGFYALFKARHLLRVADVVAAISLEAFDGRYEPFMEILHNVRPHRGQQHVASFIRRILEGSEIIKRPKKHVQDPYSFRCIPQVHGATYEAVEHAGERIMTEINSVTDNPIVFPDEGMIISGGNFHGQPLALVFDYMAIALADLGSISERRVYRLISGQRNLPEFLIANPGLNSGFMLPQYTAAAIVSQNKQLATPASVDSIPSSNEQEDHVSMGANAATKLLAVVENLEKILAIELLSASQALEFRRPLRSSDFIENIMTELRKEIAFVENDRVLYTDIEKSVEFILNYDFKF
ncbi:MAG: histidine ammonia-lyase [Bacteroidales bacterium]|nr:histidine ammonia-lyase [Bacteroidales bacterium]